jgi:hypothetical protein
MGCATRILTLLFSLTLICPFARAGEADLRSVLTTENIDRIRVNLNPWGPHLGAEIFVAGDHPGITALLSVIRDAAPSGGHKCANRGAIRFWMDDGRVVAVGLLPGHSEGIYQFRLYDGSNLVGVYSVQRNALVTALEGLGVPSEDPAFGN